MNHTSIAVRARALNFLNQARPAWICDAALLAAFGPGWPGLSQHALRRELDYLQMSGLITIDGSTDVWLCKLTRRGIDLLDTI